MTAGTSPQRYACLLFDSETDLVVLNAKTHPSRKAVRRALLAATARAEARQGRAARLEAEPMIEPSAAASSNGAPPPPPPPSRTSIVLDGEIIGLVMSEPELQLAFLQLTQLCHSVVGCRCAPSQKAQLVQLVRRNVVGAVTLSIGDGANDVAMIQAAHVGVGISGQEGMQAANSADFSFGQFRFLTELLLVHGRNQYRNMANLIGYIFYKSFLLTLVIVWYLIYNKSSGQKIYLEVAGQAFNFIWTGFPIIICSLMDKDMSNRDSRALPQAYHLGVRGFYWNLRVILLWSGEAVRTFPVPSLHLPCTFPVPSLYLP